MERFDVNAWMAEHGYTQATLAKALDVSRWTVKRNQERGESPRQFVLACKALEAIARAALMEWGHAETVFGDDWSDAHKRAAGKAFTQAYHDTHGPLADLLKLK